VLIVWPRFAIDGPSFIDDWWAISKAPGELRDVAQLLNPDAQRFRPGWTLWEYLQWHTLGAPGHLLGPNLWGIARLLLFTAGLATFTAVLIRRRDPTCAGFVLGTLVALPPLVVLTTPDVAVGFARFGPQEPLLLGGMALGGSLLYLGLEELLRGRRRRLAAVLLLLGYALWLLGVYQKETSLCVLVLAPFLLLGARGTWLAALRRADRAARRNVLALAVVVMLPLAHVAVEVVRIVHRGDLVYGAKLKPSGVSEAWHSLTGMSDVVGSHIGWVLLAAALLGLGVSVRRRRPDWLLIGLLLTALVSLAWSAQTGERESRYYMPLLALLAVGVSLTLIQVQPLVRWLSLVALVVYAGVSAVDAHHRVDDWAGREQAGASFVGSVADLVATRCPVVQTGLEVERTVALPVLVDLRRRSPGSCDGRTAYLVAGSGADPSLAAICPAGRRRLLSYWEHVDDAHVYRCSPLPPTLVAMAARHRLR
jgi:hypothetical protein